MKKLSKVENYQDFINLSPTSDATDIGEYSEILDYSLNNKDIQNIAVFGNYGAGKSSFLKTYFKDKNNYINITLGTYGKKWIVNIFLDNFYKDNCKRYCTGV